MLVALLLYKNIQLKSWFISLNTHSNLLLIATKIAVYVLLLFMGGLLHGIYAFTSVHLQILMETRLRSNDNKKKGQSIQPIANRYINITNDPTLKIIGKQNNFNYKLVCTSSYIMQNHINGI